jgi:hypothetical protein
MQRLEDTALMPNDAVTAADPMPRRSKLRELIAQVLNRFRLEPYDVARRLRYPPHAGPM